MPEDRIPSYEPKQKPEASCSANSEYDAQEQRIRDRIAEITHQVLVLSGKGGVGKSTVAANLAWALAVRDLKTGLLDADINGPTIPLITGLVNIGASGIGSLEPVPVLEQLKVMSMGFLLRDPDTPTIWRGPLKGGVIRQFIGDVNWGPLDYLVVDLPPGTGDEPLTVAQAFPAADGGIIVTTPQEASLAVCRKAVNFLKAVRLPCLGVVENMSGFVCPHCGTLTPIFSQGGGEAMAEQMGVPFLGSLPLAPEIVELSDHGQPLLGAASPAPVRKAFDHIVARLLGEA